MHPLKAVVPYFPLVHPQAENLSGKASQVITSSVEDFIPPIWVAIKTACLEDLLLFYRFLVVMYYSPV